MFIWDENFLHSRTCSESTQGPSWGYLKVNFPETLSIFGDKRQRNGSKNGEMAPRTKTGYPHIGPFVDHDSECTVVPVRLGVG